MNWYGALLQARMKRAEIWKFLRTSSGNGASSSMSEDGSWPSYDNEVDAEIDSGGADEHLAEGQVAIDRR
jgi:hypothetical protein